MLRTVTIATLVLVNVSVWLGPAERFVGFTLKAFDSAPRIERAEHFVYTGDTEAAFQEYEALAQARPGELLYRHEFGRFCYFSFPQLLETGNHTEAELSALIRAEFQAARNLDEKNYALAYEYAMMLMDETMMRTGVSRDEALEAWEHVLALLDEQRQGTLNSYEHSIRVAQAYTQMARVESRLGGRAKASGYLQKAEAAAPGFRIPENLISSNAALMDN